MVTIPEDQFLNNLELFGLDRINAQEALDEVKSITILQKGTAHDLKVLLGGREVSEKDILPHLAGKGLNRTKTLEALLDMKSARISRMQQGTRHRINTLLPPVAPPPATPQNIPEEKEYEDSEAGKWEEMADKVDHGMVKGIDAVQEATGKAFQLIKNHPKKAALLATGTA